MKHLLLIAFIFSVSQAFSQVDTKAKEILDKVSQTTKSYTSITADFDFIMENREVDIRESNEGNIIIQKEKYKLTISGIEIYNNGANQWTYMPDAEEVNISSADSEEEEMINPASIFTIYEKGFINTYLGEFTNNGRKTYKIELTPTEEQEFSRVIIEINQKSYQIISAIMFGTDGNQYAINIKNMKTETNYNESTFQFNTAAYPNVDVIDMR